MPNYHDIVTDRRLRSERFPRSINVTCGNYASSHFGKVMLEHVDCRDAGTIEQTKVRNDPHQSRDRGQEGLASMGGNCLFHCFAQHGDVTQCAAEHVRRYAAITLVLDAF
jgi:hypothetical protein